MISVSHVVVSYEKVVSLGEVKQKHPTNSLLKELMGKLQMGRARARLQLKGNEMVQ